MVSFFEKEGLVDVSFSRKNVNWGIPVPWDKSHTVYVWADAFLNYLTGLGWDGTAGKVPLIKGDKGVSFWPASVQLMSKDILRVHTTIWAAMLLSLELLLPEKIFIHGYFQINGQKMGKSLGNVIAPADLIKKYGVDATRYLIMSATAFGHDGDIGWEKFNDKYNADLANGLGNLAARVSNLLQTNKIELDLAAGSDKKLIEKYEAAMQAFKFDEALKVLWEKLRDGDTLLSDKKPWKLKGLPDEQAGKEAIKNILEPIAQNILNVADLLKPFMPTVAEKIVKQFSAREIKKGEPLFPRI